MTRPKMRSNKKPDFSAWPDSINVLSMVFALSSFSASNVNASSNHDAIFFGSDTGLDYNSLSSPFYASGQAGTAINLFDNTVLFENADAYHFFKDLVSGAITAGLYASVPLLYSVIAYHASKQFPDQKKWLSLSVKGLTVTMGGVATAMTIVDVVPRAVNHASRLRQNQAARRSCNNRSEPMPVLPMSSWASEHLFMSVKFDQRDSGTLVVKRLRPERQGLSANASAPIEFGTGKSTPSASRSDSHWQHLESVMALEHIDSLSLSVTSSEDERYLELITETSTEVTRLLMPILSDLSWDIEKYSNYCVDYKDGQPLLSVFQPAVIHAVANALSSESQVALHETLELLSSDTVVVSKASQKKLGAVVDLGEGGQVMHSDQSGWFSLSSGFILLAEHSTDEEELLEIAESPYWAQAKASMKSRQVVIPEYLLTAGSTIARAVMNGYAVKHLNHFYWNQVLQSYTDSTFARQSHAGTPEAIGAPPLSTDSAATTQPQATDISHLSAVSQWNTEESQSLVTQAQRWVAGKVFSGENLKSNALVRSVYDTRWKMMSSLGASFMFTTGEAASSMFDSDSDDDVKPLTLKPKATQGVSKSETIKAMRMRALENLVDQFLRTELANFDFVELYNFSMLQRQDVTHKQLLTWDAQYRANPELGFRALGITSPEKLKPLIGAIVHSKKSAEHFGEELSVDNLQFHRQLSTALDYENRQTTQELTFEYNVIKYTMDDFAKVLSAQSMQKILLTESFLRGKTVSSKLVCEYRLNFVFGEIYQLRNPESAPPKPHFLNKAGPGSSDYYPVYELLENAKEIGQYFGLNEGESVGAALLSLIQAKELNDKLKKVLKKKAGGKYAEESSIAEALEKIMVSAWSLQLGDTGTKALREQLSEIAIRGFRKNIFLDVIHQELKNNQPPAYTPLGGMPVVAPHVFPTTPAAFFPFAGVHQPQAAATAGRQPYWQYPQPPVQQPLYPPVSSPSVVPLPVPYVRPVESESGMKTLEYKTFLSSYSEICETIGASAIEIMDKLFEKKMISQATMQSIKAKLTHNGESQAGSALASVILDRIKNRSDDFHNFIEILSQMSELLPLQRKLSAPFMAKSEVIPGFNQLAITPQVTAPQVSSVQSVYSYQGTYGVLPPQPSAQQPYGDNTPEYKTVKALQVRLELALSGSNRELVHWLEGKGVMTESKVNRILNVRSGLSEDEIAAEVVKDIKKRINLDPTAYHSLYQELHRYGNRYTPILRQLDQEYAKHSGSATNPVTQASYVPQRQYTSHPQAAQPHYTGQASSALTLPSIMALKDTRGQSINVIEKIGTSYHNFGVQLLNDHSGDIIDSIIREKRERASDINREIIRRWMQGNGKQPVSWNTFISTLNDIGLRTLVSQIQNAVFVR